MKRSEVSIKTRSTPASLSFKGQATKHTTVKWSILYIAASHLSFASLSVTERHNIFIVNIMNEKVQERRVR